MELRPNAKIEKIVFDATNYRIKPKKGMTFSEALLFYYFKKFENKNLYKIRRDSRLFSYKKLNLDYSYSIPDFYYREGDEFFFVESKQLSDGLSYKQLKWIFDNPKRNVRIVFFKAKVAKEYYFEKYR